jgi:hypothetical protein
MWNGHKIAYICATFFGKRGKQPSKAINFYAEDYLPPLLENATCIDHIIIPCNANDEHLAHYEHMEAIVEKFRGVTDIPITLFRRDNRHFSYGAWNEALREHCDDIDFAFLMEDDYAVYKHGFDAEILSRYYRTEEEKEHVLFCASWFEVGAVIHGPGARDAGHAAISNGLINVKLFREHGNEFFLAAHKTQNGPYLQATFLQSFKDKGLGIRNMASEYFTPFYKAKARHIHYYGNLDGPVVFVPVQLVVAGGHPDGEEVIAAQQAREHTLPEEQQVLSMGGFSVLSGGVLLDD